MINKRQVIAKEEALRHQLRELPAEQRLAFFNALEPQLKDPDTYSVLNFLFIAGLHHFYLGKWQRGIINILIFWLGIGLLFTPISVLGIVVVASITALELYDLFRSQVIVQDYNNTVMARLYEQVS